MSGKDSETKSITLRIRTNTLERLRRESDRKQTSLNALVSHIMNQYLDWHSLASGAGFIPVRKELILKLLEKVSEQEVIEIANYMALNLTKDSVLGFAKGYSSNAAIEFLESWLKASEYLYRHEITDPMHHTFIIQHDMGKKWSLYLAELITIVARQFNLPEFKFEIAESILHFSFDIK